MQWHADLAGAPRLGPSSSELAADARASGIGELDYVAAQAPAAALVAAHCPELDPADPLATARRLRTNTFFGSFELDPARFPDYELTDHTKTRRRLSELQGGDPMILVLSRGHFCPKDHQQQALAGAGFASLAATTRTSCMSPFGSSARTRTGPAVSGEDQPASRGPEARLSVAWWSKCGTSFAAAVGASAKDAPTAFPASPLCASFAAVEAVGSPYLAAQPAYLRCLETTPGAEVIEPTASTPSGRAWPRTARMAWSAVPRSRGGRCERPCGRSFSTHDSRGDARRSGGI